MTVNGTVVPAVDGPSREERRIDVHAHFIPPLYRRALADADLLVPAGIPLPDWDPGLAREFMAQHGIATQMLSISDPGVQFLPVEQQARMARDCNDELAQLVESDPAHFGGFAVLPLDEPKAACAEAVRALDELRLDGIILLSRARGRYLGDSHFEPLLRELDQRGAWVFVHPYGGGSENHPSYGVPTFVAEFPFDTTRTILSLLFSGALDRHPGIRWQFAHGGGTIAFLRMRARGLAAHAKQFGAFLGLPPGHEILEPDSADRGLRRAFYDTALIADSAPLSGLRALTDSGHILFGSDWPFSALTFSDDVRDPAPELGVSFNPDERRLVDHGNAISQFPRLQRAVGE